MTVSSTTAKDSYTGNNSDTVFAYTFRILDEDDIEVTVDGLVSTINTDYTVSGVGDSGGGNITFLTAPATDTVIVFRRDIDITQGVDYVANDAFPAETHELALDRLTMIAQELNEEIDRTFSIAIDASASVDPTIPDPGGNAGSFLKVTADELGFEYGTLAGAGTLNNPVTQSEGGTGTTTGELALTQGADRAIWVNENDTSAGDDLTIKAGTAATGGSDIDGGDLNLMAGSSEGTGVAAVTVAAPKAGTSGSTQNMPQNAVTVTAEALTHNPHGTSAGETGEARFEELAANGSHYTGFKAPDALAGNVVYTLPLADGTANHFLQTDGSGTLTFAEGGATQAVQADIEAETNEDTYIPPDLAVHHPGVAKAWVNFDGSGVIAINESYNVTSLTDQGVGRYDVNFTTAFSSANYALAGSARDTNTSGDAWLAMGSTSTKTTSSCGVVTSDISAAKDFAEVNVIFFGDR